MTRHWCSPCAGGVRLAVQVAPNGKKTEVLGPLDDSLKIRLQAQPIEGKANLALVRYLAQALDVPRSAVVLTHGLSSKHKLLEIQAAHLSVAEVTRLLWPETVAGTAAD